MEKQIFSHELIRALGFTSYRLAKKAETSYPSMINYLTGKQVPLVTSARRICDILNMPLDMVIFPCEIPKV